MKRTDNLKPFKSGNPGRPKGSPNKFTTLKQAFLEAFETTGGTQGLADWIKKSERNRAMFYSLVTKLFPQEVAHSGEVKGQVMFVMSRPAPNPEEPK